MINKTVAGVLEYSLLISRVIITHLLTKDR